MKFLRWLIVVSVLLSAQPVFAADWSVEAFYSSIDIQPDASIKVTERIQAIFDGPRHGIFRHIPWRYGDNTDQTVTVPVTINSVTNDTFEPIPYAVSQSGDEVEIKIGDPDVTVTGAQTYHITYTVKAAVNFLSDHDELYWNVTGTNWDIPLNNIEASVRMPAGYQVHVQDLQATCYTGASGSRAQDCTTTLGDSAASYHGDDYLTIVFGWPKDVITKPADYDQLRSAPGPIGQGYSLPRWLLWVLNLGIPLLTLIWIIRRWLTHGRDPQGRSTIVPEYDPPAGLTPGEMGTLIDEKADQRDIVATIVDLAVRGYLTITELAGAKFLGLGHSLDYQLDKKTPKNKTTLQGHEKIVYDALFKNRDVVTLDKLKGSFASEVRAAQEALYEQVRDAGLFTNNPKTVRTMFMVGGVVAMGLGFFSVSLGIFGLIISGLIVVIAAPFMPKRTDQGVAAFWQTKGFKLFLEKAEKYRIKWQEKENIFERYLPYAMVLGVADKWSKAFAGIEQAPPDWYHGSGTMNSVLLWSALNNFTTTSLHSFSPPAASGNSGFGGGGFSGGGFGGGGGGSW